MTNKLTTEQAADIWNSVVDGTTYDFIKHVHNLGYQAALADMQGLVDHGEALKLNAARERNR